MVLNAILCRFFGNITDLIQVVAFPSFNDSAKADQLVFVAIDRMRSTSVISHYVRPVSKILYMADMSDGNLHRTDGASAENFVRFRPWARPFEQSHSLQV